MHRAFFQFFLFLIFAANACCTEDTSNCGSVIITYQTVPEGERLDRIRFWLRGQDQHQQMYPREGSFVNDPSTKARLVVIDNLPAGKYILEFIIPNKDGYFEEVPLREFTVTKGSAVKIDQAIKPKANSQVSVSQEPIALPTLEAESAPIQPILIKTPEDQKPNEAEKGAITVINSLPEARFVIYSQDIKVYSGKGSEYKIALPSGEQYRIQAEDIEGYNKKITPDESFPLGEDQTVVVEVRYERQNGYIEISSLLPNGEDVKIDVIPETPDLPHIKAALKSQGGRLYWKSKEIPTGTYTVKYYPANPKILPVEPQKITVFQGSNLLLTPEFFEGRRMTVTTNSPEASFTLTDESGKQIQKGSGLDTVFQDLKPGIYFLNFSSPENSYYIPPKTEKVIIRKYQDASVKATYQIGGKIRLISNSPRTAIKIESLDGLNPSFEKEFAGGTINLPLMPGQYRVSFDTYQGMSSPPQEIRVQSAQTQDVNAFYRPATMQAAAETPKGQLILVANTPDANFKISETSKGKGELATEKVYGNYKGKYQVIPLQADISYKIIFGDVNRYKAPQPLSISVKKGETKTLTISYIPINQVVAVAAGSAIVGDPAGKEKENEMPAKTVELSAFSIGIYEVTNAQYAYWLTESAKLGKILYAKEGDHKGQVLDLKGNLICKTVDGDALSQIIAIQDSQGYLSFLPAPGKDQYPVIFVTWHGAIAYCKDNEGRLPTEAEWEKAAGMALTSPGQPLVKYLYGFSRNAIDRTLCNYRSSESNASDSQVLTTEVGFYNGLNRLPLGPKDTMQYRTSNAFSPVGAYDMSGNVWEWVNDWYSQDYYKVMPEKDPQGPENGIKKVAKGGCYDSLAEGVRVAERLALSPDHCDRFTGFRIAK